MIPESQDVKTYSIRECTFAEIRPILELFHYKGGHMGGGISVNLALLDGAENVIGGVVVGKPRQEKAYNSNGAREILELRRMVCLDACPRNTESYFLSKILHYLKRNTTADAVISYSDKSVGHMGTIYKAANFTLIGETAPSKHVFWEGKRYHPRSLTIDRPYSYRLREAVKTGEAVVETGEPKLIFWYELDKRNRKALGGWDEGLV